MEFSFAADKMEAEAKEMSRLPRLIIAARKMALESGWMGSQSFEEVEEGRERLQPCCDGRPAARRPPQQREHKWIPERFLVCMHSDVV